MQIAVISLMLVLVGFVGWMLYRTAEAIDKVYELESEL